MEAFLFGQFYSATLKMTNTALYFLYLLAFQVLSISITFKTFLQDEILMFLLKKFVLSVISLHLVRMFMGI